MKYSHRMLSIAVAVSFVGLAPALADQSDDTMRVAFAEEILNLDYNYTTKREYIILSDLIDEGLFDYDPASNTYVPSVATGFTYVLSLIHI